jgi:amino acid transporter
MKTFRGRLVQKTFRSKLVPEVSKGTLGTFAGVFTPSILTILGIILFLRLGYVVGQAGLARALAMIGLANAISVLTSFSLAAIATNLKVKGGGDYYLISRTLGVEFGGAIGIVLFLAQSVSIAFYCMGFGEAGLQHVLLSGERASTDYCRACGIIPFLFCVVGRRLGDQVPVSGNGYHGRRYLIAFCRRDREMGQHSFAPEPEIACRKA